MSGEQEPESWEAPFFSPQGHLQSMVSGGWNEVNFILPAFQIDPWRRESGTLLTELRPNQIFGVTKYVPSLDLQPSSVKCKLWSSDF